MRAEVKAFAADISADDLADEVSRLSRSPDVPRQSSSSSPCPARSRSTTRPTTNKFDVFDAIAPEKDVDGVGRDAVAALYRAQQERMLLMPGTALAVRRMMAFYGVETEGKQAVVVGRNDITSKPILHMLGGRMCNAAAIWCHRHVAARRPAAADPRGGHPGHRGRHAPSYRITADMVKPGVAVFDVATRVDAAGKMHGDVDFEAVRTGRVASSRPFPRGVGPVTVAALCENLFRAAQLAAGVGTPGYAF